MRILEMARRTYDVNEEGSGGQRRGRRKASLKVCMLDDSVVKFDIEVRLLLVNLYLKSTVVIL